MWALVMASFSFFSQFSETIKNFVLDHLHLVMAWFVFLCVTIKEIFVLNNLYLVVLPLFTFFSFQIKNFLWDRVILLYNGLFVGSNVLTVTRDFDILERRLNDVEKEIKKDEASMKKHTEEVEGWMKRVEALRPSVESIITDYDNRSYFSNVYSIGIRAVNKLKEVRQEAEFIKSVKTYTTAAPLPSVQWISATPIVISREMLSILQEADTFLRDDAQGMLGVYGMGGIGKTTLLIHINNASAAKDASFGFDRVVLVTASRGCTIGNIQMSIAKALGLSEGGDQFAKINKYLSDKSFLILVDDLWERLDIEEMGIPLPHPSPLPLEEMRIPLPLEEIEEHEREFKRKRKMILVSRDLQVLHDMGVRRSIKVECLSREAARLLFREQVGAEAISSHHQILELANQVADQCVGMPQALITIGRAMAENRIILSWENAVEDLRKSISNFSENHNIAGKKGDPLLLLKVSYDYLNDERKKQCLLHCALWPEDWRIPKDELIQCWMGHGLLGEINNLQEAYRKGHARIESLQKASLLEHAEFAINELKDSNVKLYDLIRDMALWIACDCEVNKNKWIVLAGQDLREAPQDRQLWREAHKISLMFNKIKSLPSKIQNSPNLTTLMLKSNRFCDGGLWRFRDGGLRVSIKYFNSLKYLVQLEYLDISNCALGCFPTVICELTKLKYLNISNTSICSLPEKLKALVNMKYLIAHGVYFISRVPPELLSNLVNLIELDLFESGNEDFASSVIDNLDCLEGHLKSLGINVTTVSNLKKLVQLSGIPISSLCLKWMEGLDSSLDLLSHDFLGSQHIRSNLKELTLEACGSVEEVVIEGKHQLNIQRLVLTAQKLKEIKWKRVEPRDALPKLRQVKILRCNALKSIEWAMYLPCLELLDLERCPKMEQMFGEEAGAARTEQEEEDRPTFPSLRTLKISVLPKLSSICHRPLTFPSLELLSIYKCEQLKKLPFHSPSSCTKLREIECDEATWKGIDLEDNMQATLNPLLKVR